MPASEDGGAAGSGSWRSTQHPAPSHVVDALKNARLLRNFTPTGIHILANVAHEKTLPAGSPLFVENMIGEGLFIIARGSIRVSIRGPDGRDAVLTSLGAGDSLGEAALLRSGPRFCSATAEEETSVLEITRRDISQLQRTKPQACLKLMMSIADVLASRMRGSEEELRRFVVWRLDQGL